MSGARVDGTSRRWRRSTLLAGAAIAFPFVLVRVLGRMSGGPRLDPKELSGPQSTFVTIRGLDLHVADTGPAQPDRTPLLLLHGFAAGLFTWERALPLLANDRRCVAYDRPGAGLSARPLAGEWDTGAWPGGSPYTPEAQADIAIYLLDQLGIDRAVFVANSAGAAVAVLAALRHPERAEGLILVAPALVGHATWLRLLLGAAAYARLGSLVARLTAAMSRRLLRTARHPAHPPTTELEREYLTQTRVRRWDTAMNDVVKAGPLPDLRERLTEVDAPALFISGDCDRVIAPHLTRTAAELVPLARYVEIPETGHMPHEERPAAFVTSLADFLRELDGEQVRPGHGL